MKPVALAATSAALASAVSIGFTLWYTSKPNTTPKPKKSHKATKYSQEIIDEQQARTRAFVQDDGLEKIRKSSIVIVGVGGVGSWAATMLVRSGVGRVRLVDFDQVTLSSLNRHACATLADVGTSKVDCLANYLRQVCPWVEIEAVNSLWTADKASLVDGFDFVVDSIDNIDTKVDLLAYCHNSKIPVISSMGAGCKGDPTRINIQDISMTTEDPLSRATRIKLRFKGIKQGIPVVFSTEKPGKDKAKLLDIDESQVEEGNVGELSVLKDFRVRILPVLGPLPAMFGLTIATQLITRISGYDSVLDPVSRDYSFASKNRTKLYESMLRSMTGQSARMRWPEETEIPITMDEVEYLYEEVWRGHALSGQTNRTKLTLWDPKQPRNIHNMVPVTHEQQRRHEELVLKGGQSLEEVYTDAERALVAKRQELDRWYQQFRA